MDPLQDIYELIDQAILEDPPVTVREGGIIKDGYHEEADRLRQAKTEGKDWLAELEAREKEKTGIKTLKVKFNKVFGYYFEVTNSFKNQVPDYFVRKQTLTNAERFTTDELKHLEDIIMGAEESWFPGIRPVLPGQGQRRCPGGPHPENSQGHCRGWMCSVPCPLWQPAGTM